MNKIKIFIIKSRYHKYAGNYTSLNLMDFGGWGNGYALIPKDHPLYGKEEDILNLNIHGGITFSRKVNLALMQAFNLEKSDLDKWCIGFDTKHYLDNLNTWPEERVYEEALKLRNLIINYEYTRKS